jgi:5'-phosphate synthase pdxT subunit
MVVKKIGILALQGNYAQHGSTLDQLSIPWQLIKLPSEFEQINGLIIPGGESTAFLKLMKPVSLDSALIKFHKQGYPIFGTCAGMILLAKEIIPEQESLGFIDITVRRNAYGRQIDSFIAFGHTNAEKLGKESLEMAFIRAPKIERMGKSVEVLATYQDQPVLVRQKNIMVATFHPELTGSARVHKYFLEM